MNFKLLLATINAFDNYFSINEHAEKWGVARKNSKITLEGARRDHLRFPGEDTRLRGYEFDGKYVIAH
jgi:hypothetical protein